MAELLYTVEVGSYSWGAQHEGSDHDLFSAVRVPTRDILSGRNRGEGAHFNHDPKSKLDVQTHEIGAWVLQLLKGNANYVMGVTSPIVLVDHPYLHDLRDLFLKNVSKAIVPSFVGLGMACKKDAERYPERAVKKYHTAVRGFFFGVNLLLPPHRPIFDAKLAEAWGTAEGFDEALKELQLAEAGTNLPDKPDPEPFHEFLLKVRLDDLRTIGGSLMGEHPTVNREDAGPNPAHDARLTYTGVFDAR